MAGQFGEIWVRPRHGESSVIAGFHMKLGISLPNAGAIGEGKLALSCGVVDVVKLLGGLLMMVH